MIERTEQAPRFPMVETWEVKTPSGRVRATIHAEDRSHYVRVRVPDEEFSEEILNDLITVLTEAREQDELPS